MAGEWRGRGECRSAATSVGLAEGPSLRCVLRQVQDVAFKVGMAGGCDRSVAQIPRARSLDTRCFACSAVQLFCEVFLDLLPALVCVGSSRSHPPSIDERPNSPASHPLHHRSALPALAHTLPERCLPFPPTHTPAPPPRVPGSLQRCRRTLARPPCRPVCNANGRPATGATPDLLPTPTPPATMQSLGERR